MSILITGSAGFIGAHLVKALQETSTEIVGVDNLNSYYSSELKLDRLHWTGIVQEVESNARLSGADGQYTFYHADVCDGDILVSIMNTHNVDTIIHLAAQAGVRHSLIAPMEYVRSNMVGHASVLQAAKTCGIRNIIFASSSSVYGESIEGPCSETSITDAPLSVYAATKRANELYAHATAAVTDMHLVGLRFFTVYGPWGRPDMAYYSFADKIRKEEEIVIRGGGLMSRDHTYIDDIIRGILLVESTMHCEKADSAGNAGVEVYNIGYGNPVTTTDIVASLEHHLEKKAQVRIIEERAGEPLQTFADTRKLFEAYGYTPEVPFQHGISHFANWYKRYIGR